MRCPGIRSPAALKRHSAAPLETAQYRSALSLCGDPIPLVSPTTLRGLAPFGQIPTGLFPVSTPGPLEWGASPCPETESIGICGAPSCGREPADPARILAFPVRASLKRSIPAPQTSCSPTPVASMNTAIPKSGTVITCFGIAPQSLSLLPS